MAKTSEKIRYILGWLTEASIERRELLGLLRKLYSKVESMSDTQNQVKGIIRDLQITMENQTTVIGGFQAFLEAHDAALTKTIQAQLDAGASADVLAPLQALRDGYKANTDALTASLVNRTEADPTNAAPVGEPAAPLLPPVDTTVPNPEPAAPVVEAPAEPAAPVVNDPTGANTGDGSLQPQLPIPGVNQ